MSVESNFVTLWEYTPATGLRFTRSPDNALPVSAYVKMIGKYRHLSQDQLDHIQAKVDEQVALLRIMASESPPPPPAHRQPATAAAPAPAGGDPTQPSLRQEIARN